MRSEPITDTRAPTSAPRRVQEPPSRTRTALAPLNRRAAALAALASICGLAIWLSLTVLLSGGLNQAMASFRSNLSAPWSLVGPPAVSRPNASGYIASGVARSGALSACDSTGESSMGANLVVPRNEVVCGDVLVVGGNQQTLGEVRGSVQVIGGDAIISGVVTGDVTVIGGNISVEPGGRVSGAAHAIGGSVTVASGAIVSDTGGDIQMPHDFTRPPGFNFTIDVGSFWLSLLFWVSAALGLTALAPEAIGHVRYTVSRHFALSGVVGALLALAGGLVSLALVFTCLGIPLALAIVVAGWLAWVVGTVGVGAWLGNAIFSGPHHSHPPTLLVSAVLGVIVLSILKVVPVAGPIIGMFVGAVALGAAMLTLISARRVSYARLR